VSAVSSKISVLIDVTVDKANAALGNFRKSVGEADGAIGKFKAGAASAGASLKANLVPIAASAGVAVAAFAAKSIAAASDLEESTNAVNKSFGAAAEGVLAIGESSAESFGLSKAEFNEAAVAFSSFAQTVAGEGGDVAGTIEDMATRAADFASVMNISVAEASTVFRSGLSGETESLKRFGIDLSAAAVEAFALANGLVKSKTEMTEAIKVQARYGLLMEKTSKFAGDFADTSDGLANSTRIAQARITDFQAEIGEQLIPAVATAVDMALTLADALESVGLASGNAGEKLDENRGFLGDVTNAIENQINPLQAAGQLWNQGAHYLDNLTGASEEATVASVDLRTSLVQESIDAALASAAIDNAAESKDELAASATEARERIEDLTSTMLAATGQVHDLEQAEIDLQDSVDDLAEAYLTALGVVEDSEATDREKAAAVRDTRSAQIDAAAQALALAEAYAAEKGAADGTVESGRLQVEKLREMQAKYPELREDIQLYIDKLLDVPGVVDTTISADTRSANASLDELLRKLAVIGSGATARSVLSSNRFRQSHTGSRFEAGEAKAIIPGEQVFVPDGPGRMYSPAESQRMMGGGAPNVTVKVMIDGQELRGVVRTEIEGAESSTVAALRGGVR
jgi:hypothetical protein